MTEYVIIALLVLLIGLALFIRHELKRLRDMPDDHWRG